MRRTLISIVAVLALPAVAPLALAAPADAATSFVLRGAGFGHGIGMSQYGAYGYARNGRSFDRILRHYYRGTELGRAPSRPVRILLQPNDAYIRVRGASRVGDRRIRPGVTYVARPAGGGIVVTSAGGGRVGRFGRRVSFSRPGRPLRLLGPALGGVRNGLYRGRIEVRRSRGVSAINSLPIDPYIQGVVTGEMPSSWHMEALKAQAVAARSYALATRKRGGSFDLYPDTRSQVYRGVRGETSRGNRAVRATRGLIVTYNGEVAVTYYFSTSGGRTENVENSFLGSEPKPWLKSVHDRYDRISPRHRWRYSFSPRQLARRLRVPGSMRKVRVLKRGVSPRIVRARFYGSRGRRVLTGPQIRARLGLPDTWVRFVRVSSSRASFRAARLSKWGRSPMPLAISGRFEPAPRARKLAVERRIGRRWRKVGVVRTARSGRFRALVKRRGVYRVRSGSVAGPAVRI